MPEADAARTMVITGTRTGIGRALVESYAARGYQVAGCSRGPVDFELANYRHYCLDVADEPAVRRMFADIQKRSKQVDVLLNNAGIASMNHALLTPAASVRKVLETNVLGTFLFCREAAKLMRSAPHARIVNFSTVAVPLHLEGEAIYAASKAAVETLTRVLARELAPLSITCNAVGPTALELGLAAHVPRAKLDRLVGSLPIRRLGRAEDVLNVIDFFIRPESDLVTGQVVYLGGAA
jgi:3-oxoacyl-[acyl-carrier protein] reductase